MTPNQKAEGLSTSSERVSETAEIEHEPIGPFDRTSSAHYTEGQADADGLKPQVRDHSETLSAFTVMRDEFFPDAKPQPLAKADEVGEAVERLTALATGRCGDARMCNCVGPQPGHTLCPCVERIRRQQKADMRAEILAEIAAEKGRKGSKSKSEQSS